MRIRFGTDGIRGRANVAITPELALALGRALVPLVPGEGIAVARDTRPSGPMLTAALIAGICSAGGRVVDLGVLPTPGLSVLVVHLRLGAGVMVTASHNAERDNGLKVVDRTGAKLSEADRARVESWLAEPPPRGAVGSVSVVHDAGAAYTAAQLAALPRGRWLAGRTLVIDAGNGAAVDHAARTVAALGARVVTLDDGGPINHMCGAVHPERLCEEVLRRGADAGIALDGDADRGVLVTADGVALNGDALLWLSATDGCTVVGTIMTNGGLESALSARGVRLVRTPVGDAWVAAAVRETGATVGAEPSGHVIYPNGLPTSDGLLSCLRALFPDPRGLAGRLEGYNPHTQLHAALAVPVWYAEAAAPEHATLDHVVADLEARGARVVVRASGTEPVVRVMVEHPDPALAGAGVDRLRAALEA